MIRISGEIRSRRKEGFRWQGWCVRRKVFSGTPITRTGTPRSIPSAQKEFPGEVVFRDRNAQAAGEIVFKDRNGRYTADSAVTPGQETIVILDETPDTRRKEETQSPKKEAGSGVPAGLIWFVCLLAAAALLALRFL